MHSTLHAKSTIKMTFLFFDMRKLQFIKEIDIEISQKSIAHLPHSISLSDYVHKCRAQLV